MAKRFNVTGLCFPDRHYMADISKQLDETYRMIEDGEYFIINRPRQYGKTTAMHILRKRLIESGYIIFHISFEGIGDAIFEDEKKFTSGFFELLGDRAHESAPELKSWILETATKIDSLKILAKMITELANQTAKKIVVFIDEVDKSSNNQLFVSFLAMLRDQYLDRDRNPTFHCVMLAGIHDVKSLKLKLRPEAEKKYNSPWNIATEFTVNMNLTPNKIKPMLADYMQEEGITMDTQLIAERLFYLTSGYPYLVSYLCKIIAEEILPTREEKTWTEADVNKAFQLILRKRENANFDTVIKNIKEYPDLNEVVYSLVIEGETIPYNDYNSTFHLGVLHGIFGRSKEDTLIIHNRIYREIIAGMMISEWRTGNLISGKHNIDVFDYVSQYHLPNKALDMQKVLVNFQKFMKKEYNEKDRKFLERDGRLIFLAFMRPIINGAGYDFKEPQVSEEKRLDLVITYYQHLYVAELKIWHGPAAHQKGLEQLADYLDRQDLTTGFLIIFDHSQKKMWTKGWKDVNGKRIFWVKV